MTQIIEAIKPNTPSYRRWDRNYTYNKPREYEDILLPDLKGIYDDLFNSGRVEDETGRQILSISNDKMSIDSAALADIPLTYYKDTITQFILDHYGEFIVMARDTDTMYKIYEISGSTYKAKTAANRKTSISDFRFTTRTDMIAQSKIKYKRWSQIPQHKPVVDFFNQPIEPGEQIFGEINKGVTCFGNVSHIGIDTNDRPYAQIEVLHTSNKNNRKTMKIFHAGWGRNNFICIDDDEFLLKKLLYMDYD